MMRHALTFGCAVVLSGCVTSDDPADGGFFNGVSGATSCTYDARVAEREQSVADAEARNAALSREQQALAAQIKSSEAELARLKFTLLQQRNKLGRIDGRTDARVSTILNANPTGATAQSRLAALRKTVADARALSAELAKLST